MFNLRSPAILAGLLFKIHTMRNFIVFLFLLVFSGGALVNAQKRSKLPRTTVEAPMKKQKKNILSQPVFKESTASVISPVTIHFQEETLEADQSTVAEVPILEQQSEIGKMTHTANMVVTKQKMYNVGEKKMSFTFSGSSLKSHTTLFKVKEVEKTAMELWVILLIIFYVLGFIFTIICLLAILLWNNFTLFIVFLILAVLFSAAGSLMLTLGQMGVI